MFFQVWYSSCSEHIEEVKEQLKDKALMEIEVLEHLKSLKSEWKQSSGYDGASPGPHS